MGRSHAAAAVLERLGITEQQIEDVRDRSDIVTVFEQLHTGKGYALRAAGSSELVANCPFHTGTGQTPSFKINTRKQVWHCWGGSCGGGDVYNLVEMSLTKTFQEAYEWLGGQQEISPEEQEKLRVLRAKRNAEAARRDALKARKVVTVRTAIEAQQFCVQLNADMQTEQITQWEGFGVPYDWQTFWGVGYLKDIGTGFYQRFYGFIPETLRDPLHAEAFSIPYYFNGQFQTVQWRFTDEAVNGMGKYHFPAWLGAHAFITRPDLPFKIILLVEGAKKAMVTHILGTRFQLQVIGIPSENYIPPELLPLLQAADCVWVLCDPDSYDKGWTAQHVATIGLNAYAVNLPGKIDDHLIAGTLTSNDLRDLLMRAKQTKRRA